MNLSNLKVGTRLYTGFGVLVVLILLLQINSYLNFSKLEQAVEWNNHTREVIAEVDGILSSLINIETGQRGFALTGEEGSLEPLHNGLQDFERFLNQGKSLTSDNPAQQERFNRLSAQQQEWVAVAINPLIELRRAVINGDVSMEQVVAEEQTGKGKQNMDAMRILLNEIRDTEAGLLVSRSEEMSSQAQWTRIATVIGAILGLFLGIAMAFWITRSIMKSLGGEPAYAAEIANSVASGDLSISVTVAENDKSSLLFSMREMRDSLVKIVSEVRVASEAITTGSDEIASGNVELSARTEQQASSLEETSSSMEELTSTVRQNADNARQANLLAESAADLAAKGGTVVSQVVETMGSINDSSKEIAAIINVMDSIAFQTNILALNASVEAARAGEQGRGFAVVASEVRNLAQRSAAAADEIKVLIGKSAEKVGAGSELVNQAGATMSEVVESVSRVSDIVSEITAASKEQLAGIEQVNQAINQIDQVTQQNSALAEQASAAADSMRQQSFGLATVVSLFKLNSSVSSSRLSSPPQLTSSHSTTELRSPSVRPYTTTLAQPELVADDW